METMIVKIIGEIPLKYLLSKYKYIRKVRNRCMLILNMVRCISIKSLIYEYGVIMWYII